MAPCKFLDLDEGNEMQDSTTEAVKDLIERYNLENKYNNARIGYQVAVDLWGIINQAHWARFSSMVVVNSIILGILGLILTNQNDLLDFQTRLSFLRLFSVAGGILTISWGFLMGRDTEYIDYYRQSAQKLEKILPPIETVAKGHLRHHWYGCFRQKYIIFFIIIVFFCVYVIIFIKAWSLVAPPSGEILVRFPVCE